MFGKSSRRQTLGFDSRVGARTPDFARLAATARKHVVSPKNFMWRHKRGINIHISCMRPPNSAAYTDRFIYISKILKIYKNTEVIVKNEQNIEFHMKTMQKDSP